jgi:hypothetical protein
MPTKRFSGFGEVSIINGLPWDGFEMLRRAPPFRWRFVG